ncbi:MAG: hypothetical protein ABI446_07280 [Gemmatimonadaceae bacterium]
MPSRAERRGIWTQRRWSDDRANEAIVEGVGLEGAIHERARHLSSGMERRVALAPLWLRPPDNLDVEAVVGLIDASVSTTLADVR